MSVCSSTSRGPSGRSEAGGAKVWGQRSGGMEHYAGQHFRVET